MRTSPTARSARSRARPSSRSPSSGYGFGGGGDAEENGGGGGGAWAIPVGAYVGDSLGVRFQPNPIALIAVSVPLVWVSGKALARVLKALKH